MMPCTTFVGGRHPYPPPPPKVVKPPKVRLLPACVHTGFSYALAVRSKPGLSTTELTQMSGQERRYAVRVLRKLADQRFVHCVAKPKCGKERFWYPGTQ